MSAPLIEDWRKLLATGDPDARLKVSKRELSRLIDALTLQTRIAENDADRLAAGHTGLDWARACAAHHVAVACRTHGAR